MSCAWAERSIQPGIIYTFYLPLIGAISLNWQVVRCTLNEKSNKARIAYKCCLPLIGATHLGKCNTYFNWWVLYSYPLWIWVIEVTVHPSPKLKIFMPPLSINTNHCDVKSVVDLWHFFITFMKLVFATILCVSRFILWWCTLGCPYCFFDIVELCAQCFILLSFYF